MSLRFRTLPWTTAGLLVSAASMMTLAYSWLRSRGIASSPLSSRRIRSSRSSRQRGKLFYRLVQQALMVDPVPEKELKAEMPSEENFDDLEL